MLITLQFVNRFGIRKPDKTWRYVNIFIMPCNICIGMVHNVMENIPHVWTGANQIKHEAEDLVDSGIARKGIMNGIMTDIKPDKCTERTQQYG